MTLLVSLYTSRGIVFAADSQITAKIQPRPTVRYPPQRKVFAVKRAGQSSSSVGFFGLAEMRGDTMAAWLRRCIDTFPGSTTVGGFAEYLRDELNAAVGNRERRVVSGFHVGGFDRRDGVPVPVFHFVRNTESFDQTTGAHGDLRDYWTQEHFPSIHADDVPHARIRSLLRQYEREQAFPYWFRNGDIAIASGAWEGVSSAIMTMASLPRFEPVATLDGFTALAKALIDTTARFYALLYRGAVPKIGGRTITRAIPWPLH